MPKKSTIVPRHQGIGRNGLLPTPGHISHLPQRQSRVRQIDKVLVGSDSTTAKNIDYQNELAMRRILDQQTKVYDVPHHAFHEIPPIPSPLTKDSFEQYIYHLTHCKFHYRNSLSLQSGIIPISYYTHTKPLTKSLGHSGLPPHSIG